MKYFLKDFFIEPFKYRCFSGYTLGLLNWFLGLLLPLLLFSGIYYLIDYSFSKSDKGIGIVVNKKVIPAHTTTTFIMSGNTMIPITTYYDTEYKIYMQITDKTDDYTVSELNYNVIRIGDTFNCEYNLGGLSNEIYITNINK